MTESFNTWTEYDNWLTKHYEEYAITSVNEIDGKIIAEFMSKEDWEKQERAAGRI